MRSIYFVFFSLSFFVSFVSTFLVSRIAMRRKIVDVPDHERRFHKNPTPTLGGVAIYISFLLVTVFLGIFGGYLLNGHIPLKALVGIWVGGAILMIGGYLDDRYRLPAKISVMFPVLACLAIVTSGIKAFSILNPFSNEVLVLMPLVSGAIVFLWTMTMTYTTKLLDGMDGLVTGISAIGALAIFVLSVSPQVMQPQTAILAITFAGALIGFLILNFHPAKIFLGEGGSTFAGFMLAVLAVVSGGKVATTLLVMGIPLLDMIWVVGERIFNKQSPFSGDRKHLHFRLTEIGFSVPQAVLFLYALAGIFGGAALFLQSKGKLIALGLMIAMMLAILASLYAVLRAKGRTDE